MERNNALVLELSKNRTLFLMLVPAIMFFLLFAYIPMFGIVLAFKRYRYDMGFFSPWVGLRNFRFFFLSGKAWLVTKNTILYNLAFIATGLVAQVGVAVVFSEIRARLYKKVSQSIMFLPYFISWVVVAAFAYNIFNYEFGTLNHILTSIGLPRVDVYNTPPAWKYILVAFNNWKYTGYGSIVYLAAIMGIHPELYESAEIDGATIFQRIFRITIPMIKPTMMIIVLLQISHILRGNFDLFFQLIGYNGILYEATDVIDTFVFRSLTQSSEIGLPAAAGMYQQVIGFVIIMTVNWIVKRANPDYALF
jgi:putative aldouronate transport system permease protein